MKPFFFFLFCVFSLFADSADDLKAEIDQIIHSCDSSVHLGVEVYSLKTQEILYEKNKDKLFTPASGLKVFTAAAALSILPQDFSFETDVFTDSKGNLYLKGGGDPTLTLEALRDLIFQLKATGLDKIQGDIFLDETIFDTFAQGPGWMWDDLGEAWNPPVNGLLVNRSSVFLWVAPGATLGAPARILLIPSWKQMKVDNQIKTDLKLNRLVIDRVRDNPQEVFSVKGTISQGSLPLLKKLPVDDPLFYTGECFMHLLKEEGMVFQGALKKGKTPTVAQKLATHSSRPVVEIVMEMMKESDNLYANALFKKIGQVCGGAPGSYQKGASGLRDFLKRGPAIDPSNMVILDGCGQSRYNLVSPSQMIQMLSWASQEFLLSAEFLASFPISGVDGSLKARLEDVRGKIRGKTGSMQGVSSLSGYAETKDEEVLAFTIFLNGFVQNGHNYKQEIEDKICRSLVNFKRDK